MLLQNSRLNLKTYTFFVELINIIEYVMFQVDTKMRDDK